MAYDADEQDNEHDSEVRKRLVDKQIWKLPGIRHGDWVLLL